MVTHNSERYVAEAIESVLSQSYENLELLICDDCSTDGTWAVVQSYQDPRIRAIRNATNLGEYPNRNQALDLASGRYLIFVDGDDILYPHGLEFMVRSLDAFPEAGLAMACPWSEKLVYPLQLSPREVYQARYLGQAVFAINFAHLLLRTAIARQAGGFDVRYRAGDTYIQYRIALEHPCLVINDGLAWWRRTPGQASERLLKDRWDAVEGLRYSEAFLSDPHCPLTPDEVEIAWANLYGGFIRLALYMAAGGRIRQAVRLLRAAQLPKNAWRYTYVSGRYPYLSDVTAAAPMGNWRHSPYARMTPR
jgi:glycosyltransferase involved in cell wall biosynthesis